jgi:hypothetical protein
MADILPSPDVPPCRAIGLTDILIGLCVYYLSGAVVMLGILLGHYFLKPHKPMLEEPSVSPLMERFFWFDGKWYRGITADGYKFDPKRHSNIAFFPLYPLAARGIMLLTGCSSSWAMLLVAHASLVAAFVFLHAYARCRYPTDSETLAGCILIAFAFLPATFFFRMAYSEALFVLITLVALMAMERRWPIVAVALTVGLVTATRPVGVALVPVFLLYLWQRQPRPVPFLLRSLALTPLACAGILAYMGYQYLKFGQPLAFALTQEHWDQQLHVPLLEKLRSLATLEPFWGPLVPSSPFYWERFEGHDNPFFSLLFLNPIAFAGTAVLTAVGWWKRWLNSREILLAVGLLLIPYVTRGYEMSMQGGARFAAAVVPVYLVAGQLLHRMPRPLAQALIGLCGFFLGAYAALFAAGYRLF